jgi:hypothetical protein
MNERNPAKLIYSEDFDPGLNKPTTVFSNVRLNMKFL